ncbi:MAG: arsenate reductase ArsC [PVC group bacterium]|nr:arsenate reductase ArsC [PVC group bacterium]
MKKKVLFLCTGNSCRSQMAEGILRFLDGDDYEAFSAGVNPTDINPLAVRAMAEIDIDITVQRSKSVTEFQDQAFDFVITVCNNAKQSCPILADKHEKIHWDMEDPAEVNGTEEEKMIVFREMRDEIVNRVKKFLQNINI